MGKGMGIKVFWLAMVLAAPSPWGARGQPGGAEGDAASGLTVEEAARLGSADAAAFTEAKAAALSPDAIARIEPSVLKALPTAAVEALTPKAVAALTPAQLQALTTPQLRAMKADQVGAIRPDVVEALGADVVGRLPTSVVAGLAPEALEALFLAENVGGLTPRQVGAVTDEQIGRVRPEVVEKMAPATVALLSTKALAALTTDAIGVLTVEHFEALSRAQRQALTAAQVGAIRLSGRELLRTTFPVEELKPPPAGTETPLASLLASSANRKSGVRLLGNGYAQLKNPSPGAEASEAFGIGIEFDLASRRSEQFHWGGQLIINKGSADAVLRGGKAQGDSLLTPQSQDTNLRASVDWYFGREADLRWGLGGQLDMARMGWAVPTSGGEERVADVTTIAFQPSLAFRWLFASETNEVEVRAYAGPTLRAYSVDPGDLEALRAAGVEDVGRATLGEPRSLKVGVEGRVVLRVNTIEVGAMVPWHDGDAAGLSGLHLIPFVSLKPDATLVTF